jgi:hypothetical protein
MKSGLKGGNAVVRLLLAHGEKIGIAAILLCAGMLIWSALSVPTLDATQTPEQLSQKASQAESHVNSFKWQEVASQDLPETPVVKSKPFEVDAMHQLAKDHWPLLDPVNPPVIPPQKLRTDPVLLAAADLEVHADSGLWATANPDEIAGRKKAALAEQQRAEREEREREARESEDDDRDGGRGRGRGRGRDDDRGDDEERPRGPNATVVVRPRQGVELEGFETINAQSWITVVARIPIKDQNNMYEDALENARGFNATADVPQYLGYLIERAEITHEGQGEWKLIKQVTDKSLIKELQSYPVFPPEVVASRFVHPVMTHPLPPLILKEWDDRVKHSSMSLAVDDVLPTDEPLEEEPAEEEAAEGEAEDDGGFGVTRPPAGAAGDPYGARGGYEMDGGRGGRGGYEMDGGRGGYGMDGGRGGGFGRGGYDEMDGGRGGYGMDGGRGGGGYGQMGTGRGVELASFTWDYKTSDILLRFFDNTVEPGHRYRYRVRLALMDVNEGVPVQHLDKTVTERREKLANAKLRTFRLTDWSDPSPIASVPLPVRLYLVAAEPAKPTAAPEAEILIKALDSKFAAEIARKEKASRGAVLNVREKAEVVWSNNYEEEQDPEFNFRTGATLVDVQGGEKLGKTNRNLVAPGRAVMMDAAGKLSILHELKDAPVVQDFDATKEMDQDGMGGGRGGYEMDGGRGGGRGGRGRGGRGGDF